MHIYSKNDVESPINTPHGEMIFELIGRNFPIETENHSLAHVVIPPQKASRKHYHPIAEESYYIISGEARIIVGQDESILNPGQAVLIPPQTPHQIFNHGDVDLEFLTFCVPAWEPSNIVYLDES